MKEIDIHACTRSVQVDHRISLPYYYRIADNLLRQVGFHGSISLFLYSSLCFLFRGKKKEQLQLPFATVIACVVCYQKETMDYWILSVVVSSRIEFRC